MNTKNIKDAIDLYVKKPKFTNLFFDFEGFKLLVTNEVFFVDGDSIFIFKKENGIHKLYFLNLQVIFLYYCCIQTMPLVCQLKKNGY